MPNRLQHETSPYLIQHAQNPVDWFPWGDEAFQRAKAEDKPVFLSIGYSTCHWCHVMAHESFEDEAVAALLNRHFISVKVDREERPDVDSIYMAVCQAFTGSGGWPASIFMTPEQKPFFAGTYFPKDTRGRFIGFRQLLEVIRDKWAHDRAALLDQAEEIVHHLQTQEEAPAAADESLLNTAIAVYRRTFDAENGGFGRAPKFPAPHNLLFLLACFERLDQPECLSMAERTLLQMYRGGLFDHIGFGFCRYSTDERFLVPHFEKMLYDNALLMLAYCQAYAVTRKPLYLHIAEKTAAYTLREMTSPEGGFYSAQDADSEGREGRYYLLTPDDVHRALGRKDAKAFCRHYDITPSGHFEGGSIPHLLASDPDARSFEPFLEPLRQYRRQRYALPLDDKILTAWNGLMIAALCSLYRLSGNRAYLEAAQQADRFIRQNLCEGDTLFVSFRSGRRGAKGFVDDYAAYLFAQLALWGATLENGYLDAAKRLYRQAMQRFFDEEHGGFHLYSADHEALILRPKETYDGAMPSGNGLMAWNMVRLYQLAPTVELERDVRRQLVFLAREAAQHPTGHAMFLLALLDHRHAPPTLTAVLAKPSDKEPLPLLLAPHAAVRVLDAPTKEYPLKNGQTTFYLCQNNTCLPPTNDLQALRSQIAETPVL